MEVRVIYTYKKMAMYTCDDAVFEERGGVLVLRWFIPKKADLMQGDKKLGEKEFRDLAQSLVISMHCVRSVLMYDPEKMAEHPLKDKWSEREE